MGTRCASLNRADTDYALMELTDRMESGILQVIARVLSGIEVCRKSTVRIHKIVKDQCSHR